MKKNTDNKNRQYFKVKLMYEVKFSMTLEAIKILRLNK